MVASRTPTGPPEPESPDHLGIFGRNPTDPPAPVPPPPGEPPGSPPDRSAPE